MTTTHDGLPPTGARVPIWPSAAPGSEAWSWTEQELLINGDRTVRNVSTPTLEIFAPAGAPSGTSAIVAPGGGFHYLSIDHEGCDLARWLAARGVTAFVLRYRVRHTPEDDAEMLALDRALDAHLASTSPDAGPLERLGEEAVAARVLAEDDGRQATRFLRANAHAWGIDPHRTGFVGFSAGADVALAAATSDDPDSRPDFVASVYGPRPEAMLVPHDAPELFLTHVSDDVVVPPAESTATWEAWRSVGRQATLHVFRTGGHGFGTKQQGLDSDAWMGLFERWLRGLGLLDPSPPVAAAMD